jgi:hypothetical protein
MKSGGIFLGLPAEFTPPERAAERLAKLVTRAEREAYWLRIPEGWRYFIGYVAALAIGHDIVALATLEARREALEQVPPILREQVEWRVMHLWRTKELREMSDAEFYSAYPQLARREAA